MAVFMKLITAIKMDYGNHFILNIKYIALDKVNFSSKKYDIFFFFLHEDICCEYSLEMPLY